MKNKNIAIIINSFNRLSLLKDGLSALVSWLPNSFFNDKCVIVIYDAGSTDGTIEWVNLNKTTMKIPIKLILPNAGEDTSFAAGLNAGVAYANEIMPDLKYLLFYETDNQILSEKPLLGALKQIQTNKDLAACGFTVRYHNGLTAGVGMPFPKIINFVLGPRLVHAFNLEAISYSWEKVNEIQFSEVDVVFTSPLLVKLEVWLESNGLDAETFPFSDCDIDWAMRLRLLGYKMGVIKTDNVIHDNCQETSSWSKTRSQHLHRARLRYFLRYYPKMIYLVWPHFLLVRHFFELVFIKLFIKDYKRRKHLHLIAKNLLASCFNRYE
tara:strand:+ start:83 stop:1054 length:972 start_codon:yes stop_codon:yes gene_type:complete